MTSQTDNSAKQLYSKSCEWSSDKHLGLEMSNGKRHLARTKAWHQQGHDTAGDRDEWQVPVFLKLKTRKRSAEEQEQEAASRKAWLSKAAQGSGSPQSTLASRAGQKAAV